MGKPMQRGTWVRLNDDGVILRAALGNNSAEGCTEAEKYLSSDQLLFVTSPVTLGRRLDGSLPPIGPIKLQVNHDGEMDLYYKSGMLATVRFTNHPTNHSSLDTIVAALNKVLAEKKVAPGPFKLDIGNERAALGHLTFEPDYETYSVKTIDGKEFFKARAYKDGKSDFTVRSILAGLLNALNTKAGER